MTTPLTPSRRLPSFRPAPALGTLRDHRAEIAGTAVVGVVVAGAAATLLRPDLPAVPAVATLTVGLIATAIVALRTRLEVLELRREDAHRRLERTRQQLTPHFLLNALNTIGALAGEDDRASTRRAVSGLGDLLRRTLAQQHREVVSVDDEVALVRDYLTWQQLRYGDRLGFDLSVDAGTRAARLPALTVQLLAENAVQHGALAAGEAERIVLRVRRVGRHLVVDLENRLPSVAARSRGLGIGLSALRHRLAPLGPDARLVCSTTHAHHRACVHVPLDAGPGTAMEACS